MEELGRPRSLWKREFAGSNPAFPTILPLRLIGRTTFFDNVNRGSNPREATFKLLIYEMIIRKDQIKQKDTDDKA